MWVYIICVWESGFPSFSSLQVSWGYAPSKAESKELEKRKRWWLKACIEKHKSLLHLGTKYKLLFNQSELAGSILADRWRQKLGNTWHEPLDLQPIWRWMPLFDRVPLAVAKQQAVPRLGRQFAAVRKINTPLSTGCHSALVALLCCAGTVRVSLPVSLHTCTQTHTDTHTHTLSLSVCLCPSCRLSPCVWASSAGGEWLDKQLALCQWASGSTLSQCYSLTHHVSTSRFNGKKTRKVCSS